MLPELIGTVPWFSDDAVLKGDATKQGHVSWAWLAVESDAAVSKKFFGAKAKILKMTDAACRKSHGT